MSMSPVRLTGLVRRCLAKNLETNAAVCLPLDQKTACREIVRLARRNFETGRYERFQNHPRAPVPLTPPRYLQHLVQVWTHEADFYYRLRQRDAHCWNELRLTLIQAATSTLGNFPHSETAEDFAQRACAKILVSEYPFDVPFKWWASTIVQNMVLARGRSKDRINDQVLSLDTPPYTMTAETAVPRQIADPLAEFFTDAIQDRDLLLHVLRRLSEQRRMVIVLSYFEEWDDTMIGAELGINPANVQTLRHRALDQLAELLGKKIVTVKESRRHRIDKKKFARRKNREGHVPKK